jgi:hypothetical protein
MAILSGIFNSANQFSNDILLEIDRSVSLELTSALFTGEIILERSINFSAGYTTISSFLGPTTSIYRNEENEIVYIRLRCLSIGFGETVGWQLNELPSVQASSNTLVNNIVERDLIPDIDRFEGMEVTVLDASDDPSVASGSAKYFLVFPLTNSDWVKIAEYESLDITTTNVPEGTNLYFLNSRARAALSEGNGIDYNNITGLIEADINTTNLQFTTGEINTIQDISPSSSPTFSSLSLTAQSASLNLNNQKISNLGLPTGASDAANKGYVDALLQGLDTKASVRVATTSNITLSGEQTIDGVAVVVGDRVLVKDQSTGAQNGIYDVLVGAWARSSDADTSAKVTSGLYTFVSEGTTNSDNGWVLITDGVIVLDVTTLVFSQFSGAGQIIAGTGLTKTGNTLNVNGTANRITANADDIDIASNYVGQTSITTLGTVTAGVWNATTVSIPYGGTGATTASAARTNLGVAIGSDVQAFDATLSSFAAYNTNGILTQTAPDTFTGRTLIAGSIKISITDGNGVAGNPTIDAVEASFTLNNIGGTLGVTKGGTGTTTAFTTGSIVFAGASGIYTQDNVNLFWDDTNNRLGIGTTTPSVGIHMVHNDGAIFKGTLSTGAVIGSDSDPRMVWNSNKAAFRVGRATGTQWDDINVGQYSSVVGGFDNKANGGQSFVGGGNTNTASGLQSFVGGGLSNVASGLLSFIGGGNTNTANENSSFVGGGQLNIASGILSFVGGGDSNTSGGGKSFVGGGVSNSASGLQSFVGGGNDNTANENSSFVGGGQLNIASGVLSFLGGGDTNTASGAKSFVGGGFSSLASGLQSFVGGGNDNTASENSSFVGGGQFNTASGILSFVGGGNTNLASGLQSFIGGGESNIAAGQSSVAMGKFAQANHNNSFVWGDGSATFATTAANQFLILATGGVGIGKVPSFIDGLDVLGQVSLSSNLTLNTVGSGIKIKQGTNATSGRATLVAGTVTVSTTKVTAVSDIQLTAQNLGTITVPVGLAVSARTAGTSFEILSGSLTDTSIVSWIIIEPA